MHLTCLTTISEKFWLKSTHTILRTYLFTNVSRTCQGSVLDFFFVCGVPIIRCSVIRPTTTVYARRASHTLPWANTGLWTGKEANGEDETAHKDVSSPSHAPMPWDWASQVRLFPWYNPHSEKYSDSKKVSQWGFNARGQECIIYKSRQLEMAKISAGCMDLHTPVDYVLLAWLTLVDEGLLG